MKYELMKNNYIVVPGFIDADHAKRASHVRVVEDDSLACFLGGHRARLAPHRVVRGWPQGHGITYGGPCRVRTTDTIIAAPDTAASTATSTITRGKIGACRWFAC